MAKIAGWLIAMFIAMGFAAANVYSAEQMTATHTDLGRPSTVHSLIGSWVSNSKGEDLGRVTDFVIDSQGRVTFVVIAYGGFLRIGGREVAVPFTSFAYDRESRHFVLDMSKERLASAPAFSARSLYNEKWAEEVYRHFGQAPYWTEGELVEKGVSPPKPEPMGTSNFPIYEYP